MTLVDGRPLGLLQAAAMMVWLGMAALATVGWFAPWRVLAVIFTVAMAGILVVSGGSLTHW